MLSDGWPKGKKQAPDRTALVPVEHVARSILVIRAQKVLLDADLAALYGVPVRHLNQAVKRNLHRFPLDFMFQLTWEEANAVSRSQTVILNGSDLAQRRMSLRRGGNIKFRPFVFTEHGAVMLASVLRSPAAIAVSVQVVRAFVRLRQLIASSEKLRRRLSQIERKLQDHDERFAAVFEAIRELMEEEEVEAARTSRIGYETESRFGR